MEESLNVNRNVDLSTKIREDFNIKAQDIRTYSPLTLAFIGDSVYEIIVRTIVVQKCNMPASKLNKEKVKYVNAAAQAFIIDEIESILTDEEEAIYHRGRNAKSYTSAKNQSVIDYRKATGLEALCGYLYLKGDMERVLELVKIGIDKYNEK